MEREHNLQKDLEVDLLVAFQYFFSSINRTFKQNGIDLELSLKSKKYEGLESNPNRVFPKARS